MSTALAKLSSVDGDFVLNATGVAAIESMQPAEKSERIRAVSDAEICACSDVHTLRRWSDSYVDVVIELETKLQFWGPYLPERMDAFYGTRSSLALFKVAIGRIQRRLKHIQNEGERLRRVAASEKE